MGKVQRQKDTINVEDLSVPGCRKAADKFLELLDEHHAVEQDVGTEKGALLLSLVLVYRQILHLHETPVILQN